MLYIAIERVSPFQFENLGNIFIPRPEINFFIKSTQSDIKLDSRARFIALQDLFETFEIDIRGLVKQ